MENIRARLITAMRDKLHTATRNQPASMAMAVPLGPLADAMLSLLAGGAEIPTVPAYDAGLMADRHWYNTLAQGDVEEGALFGSFSVQRQGDYVVIPVDYNGEIVRFKLPPHDAADFGLNIVSAAYADDPAIQVVSADADTAGVQSESAAEEHPITETPRLIQGDEGDQQ